LPIGGIASLDKIPEDPKQEFLIAIAGPLVNIIIAIFLYFLIPVQDFTQNNLGEALVYLSKFTLKNFLIYLFVVNVALFVFNLIPAFPMDGGRVFRALLALKINRVKATQIATNVGQFIAAMLLLFGLLFNPFLIFIALIIFLGAYGENRYVQTMVLLKNHTVKEAMLKNFTKLNPNNTISDVIDILLSGSETNFIVVNKNDDIEGILFHEDIIKNSKSKSTLVKDLMHKSFKTLLFNSDLSTAYRTLASEKHPFLPVLNNNKLVGAINLHNLNEFIMLQTNTEY
jgi:CBS domain-containing protein